MIHRHLTVTEQTALQIAISGAHAAYADRLTSSAAALAAVADSLAAARKAVYDPDNRYQLQCLLKAATTAEGYQACKAFEESLNAPLAVAEQAFEAARQHNAALQAEAQQAELTAAFLAGARSGFRWGISSTLQSAGLQDGEYLSLGSREEALASLTMAMTDDQVADRILTALAVSAESKESLQ